MAPGPKNRDKRRDDKKKKKEAEISVKSERNRVDSERTTAVLREDQTDDFNSKPQLPEEKEKVVTTEETVHRKRQLVSNWSRYDEPVETIDDRFNIKRGEDFEFLVNSSVATSAHFHYKEDKLWSEDTKVDDFLSLDCDNLTAALSSIPLHERLNLSEDIFPPEMILELKMNASGSMQRFLSGDHARTFKNEDAVDSLQSSLMSALKGTRKPKVYTTDNLTESLKSCLTLKTPVPPENNAENASTPSKDTRKNPLPDSKTDLDFLLSIVETTKKSSDTRNEQPVITDSIKPEEKVPENPKEDPKPELQNETVNLEDWLDSVLDD